MESQAVGEPIPQPSVGDYPDYETRRVIARTAIRAENDARKEQEVVNHKGSPTINAERWKEFKGRKLPGVADLIANLIEYLGDRVSPDYGKEIPLTIMDAMVKIGASTEGTVRRIIQHGRDDKLIAFRNWDHPNQKWDNDMDTWLAAAGWAKYEQLKSNPVRTKRQGFMAMDFRDKDSDEYHVYDMFLAYKKALEKIGFDLIRVDSIEKTGPIPEKILVDIRESKFVIADLTHENEGVYWEAGVGEGMNKKVVYSCNKDYLKSNGKERLHFDINAHNRIEWLLGNGETEAACDRLINIIKNEFPEDYHVNPAEGTQ